MQVTTNTISISKCRLQLARPLRKGEATAIRGFFGRKFEDEIFMHNHEPDGKPVYQYPRVQYKVVDQTALLVGVNEGSELLQRLWLNIDETKLGEKSLPVLESQFETSEHEIELSATPLEYRFITPWLALNQKNFAEYNTLRTQNDRAEKLGRMLIGNCLSLCKSLGIPRFTDGQRIITNCSRVRQIKTTLKGKTMIGFVGKFTINLDLPDHIGLGKSVSRGFGTIDRTKQEDRC